MKPIGIVKYWKLPRNQSGAWCHSLPWRSVSGTQSIERTSMPRMPPCWERLHSFAFSSHGKLFSRLPQRGASLRFTATVGDAVARSQ